ncbi:MAG: hypothetical protein JZU49_04660, partial [Sulfuricurvum sp.]|nr:hypothetical protein [Sulfuricurvum sp.]
MNKLLYIFTFFFLFSCVSSKKFNQLTGNLQDCERTVQTLKEQNQSLNVQNTELQSKIGKQIRDIEELSAKLKETSQNLENSSSMNQRLKQFNTELENQLSALKAGSSEEIARLMGKLQEA